jgi:hypothetical protein
MKAEEMYGNGGYRCESDPVLLGKPVLTSFTSDVGNGAFEPSAGYAAPAHPVGYGATNNA